MCDSEEYSLYVNDLPSDLGKPGMNRIFSPFGAVKTILIPDDAKFAFVVYSTYAEAEAAINGLDNKPPLYLKVSFRKQKNTDGPNKLARTNGNHSPAVGVDIRPDFRYSNPMMPEKSRIQYGDLAQINPPTYGLSPHHYHMEPNGYVPSRNHLAYNPYDDLDYASTNAMWSRGCLSIDAAGRRHVSMGRGHTLYHIPNPYPNIEDHISKVYEVRNPLCYRYGINELQQPTGKCMLCSDDAIFLCSQCDGYYCTRECQANDWPKHKNVCAKLPPLTYATSGIATPSPNHSFNTNSLQQSSSNQQHIQDVSPKSIHRSQSVQVEKNNTTPLIQRSASYDCNSHTIISTNKKHIQSEVPFRMRAPSQETLEKPTHNLAIRLQNARSSNVKPIADDDFVFKRPLFLSKTEYTAVQIVVVLEPGLYYVQKISDMGNLGELMTTINKKAAHLPIVSKVIVGKIYGTLYDGIWHRALVLSEKPLRIDYIDYGTIEKIEDAEFRELGELAEVPRYSQIIKLSSCANDKFKSLIEESTINVKMIDVNNDGTINVEIMDENEPAVSNHCELTQRAPVIEMTPQSSVNSVKIKPQEGAAAPLHQQNKENLPSILDKMVVGMGEITAGISEKIDDHTMLAVLLCEGVEDDFTSLLEPFEQECEAEALKHKNFRPQLNDLVCAKKTDDTWVRGHVIAISPTLTIASLDEGITVEVDKTIPILPRYKQICTFSGKITTVCKFPAKLNSQVNFKITDRQIINGETVVKGEFIDEGFKGVQVDIRKWILPNTLTANEDVRKSKLVPLKLENNSRVIIQAHRGTSVVFLRSLEEQELERYCRLTQEVAKAAQIAPNLTSLPLPGDLVFAKYIDDNYYRALVIALDGNQIKIGYIDYGNNEVTELKKLKEMPQPISELPRASARVVLKEIQKVPPTKEAIDYLGMLAANETPLICTFDGTIENGVTLKTAAGESVNECVNHFLIPSYKKDDEKEDTDFLQLGDMDIGKLGNIGDTINVYFLDTIQAGLKYVFAPSDNDLIRHISEVLPTLLAEYCETVKKYIPRANELCIAQFEEGWYRGCCLKPSLTPTSAEVYFLDFGNVSEVSHDDIRVMNKDFLKPAPLGCICNVKGLVPESRDPSPELLAELETLLNTNELYKIKILNYDELEWIIHLPEIRKALMDKGLITS